jgi:lysophospholipase L1-like esterase
MLLGDSITAGVSKIPQSPEENQSDYEEDLTYLEDRVAYRGKLWDLLKEAKYEIDFVGSRKAGANYGDFDQDHEGWFGRTTKYIKENITSWYEDNPADIVLLHIGTNDGAKGMPVGTNDDLNQDSNTSVNNVKKILTSIFEKNPNAKVFVARIIEAKRIEAYSNWRTDAYNNKIEEMVNAHPKSANLQMVNMQSGAGLIYNPCGTTLGDMNPFYQDKTYDLHPNINGYEKMAKKWFDAMLSSGWLPINNTEWLEYEKLNKIATITPLEGFDQSIIRIESGLDIEYIEELNRISFHHKLMLNEAYITANSKGEIKTGFKNNVTKSSTLILETSFNPGTITVLKKNSKSNKIQIESTLKLNKNEFFTIGGE